MEQHSDLPQETSELRLRTPYLVFLGDAAGQDEAALGRLLADWRPEVCVGQLRHGNCRADTGLPDMDVRQGIRAGARSLLIGTRPKDNGLRQAWESTLHHALESGLDLVSGLDTPLESIPRLANAAFRSGSRLVDLRRLSPDPRRATGGRRAGRRLLTLGSGEGSGAIRTALAVHRSLREAAVDATFRATGPGGVLISGAGMVLEGIPADRMTGAVEALCPEADPRHWDVVQGQASLDDPARSPLALALLHGAQPDALVLCLDRRELKKSPPDQILAGLPDRLRRHEEAARLTNPGARCVALSVGTEALDRAPQQAFMAALERAAGVPVVDVHREGAGRILDALRGEPGLTSRVLSD